jgi:hypothetical protein
MSPLNQRRSRRGANALEFALTLPVFLVFMLGVVDYGYLMMCKALLDASLMEGTREGAITDPALVPNIRVVAQTTAAGIVAGVCTGCTFNCVDSGAPPARELSCTGSWPITPLVGFVPMPANITSQSRQVLEWQR